MQKKLNLRNTFYYDLIDFHNNYDTPPDLFMFIDEDKFPIPVAHNGFRTKIEIKRIVIFQTNLNYKLFMIIYII